MFKKRFISMLVLLMTAVTGAVAQTDLETPLTLKAITNGTITITNPKSGMQFSKNGGTKSAVPAPAVIEVNAEDVVTFYGASTSITSYSGTKINCDAQCYIYGNIMSLVDEDDFANATALTANYAFYQLFKGNSHLCSHSTKKLVLPATTLKGSCYESMFANCTSLTTAPELPATTLAAECYYYMFNGCTSLTTAPKLPATTLAASCYYYMFNGCTSLTTAPELPATTLAASYVGMFNGCTSLTTAPEKLPATTLAERCYSEMFYNCTSLTIAPELPATTLAENCYSEMFENCTSLTTAPELPAETLEDYCYYYMFYGCTSLTSVTCLATNIAANGSTSGWLDGVAGTGTFIKDKDMGSWTTGVSGIPSGWTPTDYVTLTDGNDLSGLSTYAGQTCWVNYTRPFTSGKASTVCLPFAYTKKTGDGSFYEFTNIEKNSSGEYVATMTDPGVSTLTANTPYLYLPNADGDFDFSGTYTIPATLEAGSTTSNGWTFKGNYENKTWTTAPTGTYGFSASDYSGGISQGQFVKVGTNVSIKPMRCYLVYGDGSTDYTGAPGMNRAASAGEQLPATIKVRLINANGELTAIGSLQTKTGEVTLDGDAWYTLDGRRIDGKPGTKGIYINNNKKVIIK